MKHHLTIKGALDSDEVRRWIERPLGRLRRRLARFPLDAVHLRALVREAEAKPRAEAALVLRLPSATLSVSEEGGDARTAVHAAFTELERRLEKEKARLRRAASWRRSTRALQRELIERIAHHEHGRVFDAQPHPTPRELAEIERFVRREVGWLEMNGELAPGEVDPRDVVDSAVTRFFAQPERNPSRRRLLQCASAALRVELEHARAARHEIRIEQEADDPRARDGEIFEFYQPDAVLRVEDLVVGLDPTPEEIEMTAELSAGIKDGLAALPARWRQAFELRYLDGLDDQAIAHVLDLGPDEVSDVLRGAGAYLRSRLDQAGLLERRRVAG